MKSAKTRSIATVGLTMVLFCTGAHGADLPRALDATIEEVAREAAGKLNATSFDDVKNIAVLPLWGECDKPTKDYLIRTLQSSIIGGPYRIMERNTQAWDNLLSEMKWDVLREDTMNQDTIQRFGRIEGCDAVLYGTLRECATYPDHAVTRLTLTLGVVETGEAKWSSGEIKSARIVAEIPAARTDMDPALIRAINEAAGKAADDLKGKGSSVAGFCVFPLLGEDSDGYVTGVLQSRLANVGCSPVPVSPAKWQEYVVANSDGRTVESMRSFAQDNGYEAFLYGTVNECKLLDRKYKAVARMTLNLVNAETGQTIWSPGEIIGTSRLDWQDAVRLAVSDPVVWVLGSLVIVLVLWVAMRRIVKSATRPR